MRARWRTTLAASLSLAAAAGLASCSGREDSPLGSTQWQVTRITDGTGRPSILPEPLQGRVYLVIGRDTFTGSTGCLAMKGTAWWSDDEQHARLSDMQVTRMPDAAACVVGEQDTADRLGEVLAQGDLDVTRPARNSLKMTRTDGDVPDWGTRRSVEFINGS